MNITATSKIMSPELKEDVLNVVGLASLASIGGYGGTFFFSTLNPLSGACYLGITSVISHVAYLIFGRMKDAVESPKLKYLITAVQLLQIPLVFYFFPGSLYHLSAATKLEIIIATAHFLAIPVFFHLGIKAWNEPTLPNIAAATSVMLSLANGLRSYIRL